MVLITMSSCNRPITKFTAEQQEDLSAPATIHFENESKKADFYHWDFGDGDSSFLVSPSHTFYKPGKYVVTLHSSNEKKSTLKRKEITITSPRFTMIEIQTPYGDMLVELFDDTPQHKENFLKLIKEEYFKDLLFHRIIDGFMIQGGDPDSRNAPAGKNLGAGGPGYQIPAEIEAGHKHFKGALAAARQGDMVNPEKKSSGSQFYIVHGNSTSADELKMMARRNNIEYTEEEINQYIENGGTPFLDNQYTVFGQIIKGLDVIDKIAKVETNRADRPMEDIKMNIIEIQ